MKLGFHFIVCSPDVVVDSNYVACKAILDYCNIKHDARIDRAEAMKRSKGCIHPGRGFVLIREDETFTNWMQLSKWIEEKGLMPL